MKSKVTILLDGDTLSMAKQAQINLSGTLNRLLREYFKLDKILEAKRQEEEELRLEKERQRIEEERQKYLDGRKKESLLLLEQLNKSQTWINGNKEDLISLVKPLRAEGFKVGYTELQRVKEL